MKASPDVSVTVFEQPNHPIAANCLRVVRVVTVANKATILAIKLHQARIGGSEPHGSSAVFEHGIGLIFLWWSNFPFVIKARQPICLTVERSYISEGAIDDPKYAKSVFVKKKADARFAHLDMALHLAGLSVEFIQSSRCSHPESSLSVFATRSDVVVGEREG